VLLALGMPTQLGDRSRHGKAHSGPSHLVVVERYSPVKKVTTVKWCMYI